MLKIVLHIHSKFRGDLVLSNKSFVPYEKELHLDKKNFTNSQN